MISLKSISIFYDTKKVNHSQICQNTEVVSETTSTSNEVWNEHLKEDLNDSWNHDMKPQILLG